MSDKFEFKKQQHFELFPTPIDFKKKPSLLQYKQVIIELNDAVNLLSRENDTIKLSMRELTDKNRELTADLKMKQKRIEELEAVKKISDDQLTKQNVIIEELKIIIGDCQAKIEEIQSQLTKSEQKLRSQMERRKKIQKVSQTNEQKIKILEENLTSAFQQNKSFRMEIIQNSKYNEQQANQLKNFSEGLRKKFQILNFQAPRPVENYLNNFCFVNPQQKVYQIREKRSFSTEKKTRRNVGHLSSTNGVKNYRNRQYPNQHLQPIKPFQNLTNPELSNELQNLKKQVAHQYTLINLKHESYNKQRVIKTLQTLQLIKRKAGRAVAQALQGSQSQNQAPSNY